jgi:tRNA dimethylallyltransferase
MAYELITILGPTASGKTKFAAALADKLDTEIISADSRQVYRGMDIGTGKDLEDYTVGGRHIPYHLIDICNAGEKYSIFRFQQDFHRVFRQIKNTPVMCGGSGLYIESVIRGYTFNGEQKNYPPVNSLIIGIDIERNLRREKISRRLHQRLDAGMLDETKRLLNSGIKAETLISYGLEYKYQTLHLTGKLNYDQMIKQLETAIHQFAKRQMTWFRGMEKRGLTVHWINSETTISQKTEAVLNKI